MKQTTNALNFIKGGKDDRVGGKEEVGQGRREDRSVRAVTYFIGFFNVLILRLSCCDHRLLQEKGWTGNLILITHLSNISNL